MGDGTHQKNLEVSWDLWDHWNDVRLHTLSPTNRHIIEDLNAQILAKLNAGTAGLGHHEYHWLGKPMAHVLEYKEHKAQWLASLDLARARFANCRKYTALSLPQQRHTMEAHTHTLTPTKQGTTGNLPLGEHNLLHIEIICYILRTDHSWQYPSRHCGPASLKSTKDPFVR
jgi:hypothetical protein